ncbi:hypothetical protein KSP39_PZI015809 [Platanthera zijinensis]|uniref:Uncharacterized protein n=1 Tax=Platanthera zijinensis TaxID=2320716 RepID=A0AAP0B869_9ASPA
MPHLIAGDGRVCMDIRSLNLYSQTVLFMHLSSPCHFPGILKTARYVFQWKEPKTIRPDQSKDCDGS